MSVAPEVHQLSIGPLTAAAFSPDRSQLATCANDNDVLIYNKGRDGWDLSATLSEHDKLITATCVKWSPNEDKFAVGSGARTIAVCSFDEENNWWVSKHLKKPLRSTVLSIDWHPNNVLIAAGSADAKARVFSAFIKGIDSKPQPSAWGEKLPFNTVCGEFSSPNGGWVHDVAFSPSGDALAFASHDAAITVVYPAGPGEPPAAVQVIRSVSLPYVSLSFLTETSLVAAGHDCQPVLFQGGADGWVMTKSLDDPNATKSLTPQTTGAARAEGSVGRLNTVAFNRFKQADTRGQSSSSGGNGGLGGAPGQTETGELKTVHQNTITHVDAYEWKKNGAVGKIYTIGKDGRLAVWNV